MKQTINRINQYFLPLLFILYIGSVTLFYHAHIVDGVTIVHSHPFHSNEGEPTTTQIQLISSLNNVVALDSILHCFVPKVEIHQLFISLIENCVACIVYSPHESILLRGPPSFVCF